MQPIVGRVAQRQIGQRADGPWIRRFAQRQRQLKPNRRARVVGHRKHLGQERRVVVEMMLAEPQRVQPDAEVRVVERGAYHGRFEPTEPAERVQCV